MVTLLIRRQQSIRQLSGFLNLQIAPGNEENGVNTLFVLHQDSGFRCNSQVTAIFIWRAVF